jgi:hypothetical protein
MFAQSLRLLTKITEKKKKKNQISQFQSERVIRKSVAVASHFVRTLATKLVTNTRDVLNQIRKSMHDGATDCPQYGAGFPSQCSRKNRWSLYVPLVDRIGGAGGKFPFLGERQPSSLTGKFCKLQTITQPFHTVMRSRKPREQHNTRLVWQERCHAITPCP